MKQKLTERCEDFFENYNVEDIIYNSAQILFVLESPHKEEIKYGYPVAGSSGLEMTKFIYGPKVKIPFGKLLNEAKKYKTTYNNLKKFSIINTSPVPLQASALQKSSLNESEKELLAILEKLRTNYQSQSHRKQDWNVVKKELLSNFEKRLEIALKSTRVKYLVPCGKFAESYLQLIESEIISGVEVISEIPHPSFNQWSYVDSLQKLEEIIINSK